MTERYEMTCEEFGDIAAELALGVLTGRERAHAIEHLDQCDAFREHVRQLSLTGEEMLGLLPGQEPSAGFETRVRGRLGLAPQRPKRSRRMLATAAVLLAAVACGLGGWGLRGVTSASATRGRSTAQAPLRSAALLTASHQTAGKIFLYDGNPRWLYMAVNTGVSTRSGTVVCQLEATGGRIITIGSFRLDSGYGSWGSPDPVDPGSVTGARLTSPNGTVLATASFTAAK